MILYLIRPIEAQAVSGLTLDQAVDEVSALNAPAWRDVLAFELHLLCEDVISYILPCFSNIWSLYKDN